MAARTTLRLRRLWSADDQDRPEYNAQGLDISINLRRSPTITLRKLPLAITVPRFTLRTLLLATAGCGVVFAIVSQLDGRIAGLLLFLAVMIAAHVLGNSLGTRLRDTATQDFPRTRWPVTSGNAAPVANFAPPRLAHGARLPRLVKPVTIAGAFCGALVGGTSLAMLYPDASGAAIGLGVISSGVLGGFAGFGTSSFLLVLRQALREAEGKRDGTQEKLN